MHTKRIILFLFIGLMISLMPLPSQSVDAQQRAPIGTNLGGIASWNSQWAFVDAFKMARPWISQAEGQGWGQGGELDLTPNGWVRSLQPGQYAETIMMDNAEYFPDGIYTVLWEGDGTVEFGINKPEIVDQGNRWMRIRPQSDGGLYLRVMATNPNDPVRNIRVIMPGFESTYQTQPFHPAFLASLQGFTTLRFMDWMETNNSHVVTWDDRPKPGDQSQHSGVALEYMILLANTLNIDPWFTMPHMADDNYIRQFARMVRDNLEPGRKAYIEYSNETWNWQFDQAHYVAEQGLAMNLAESGGQAGLFYHAHRAMEIFDIWEQEFGSRDRFVRVLASQSANPWTGQQVMSYNNAAAHADVLAIAPYFSANLGSPDTVSQVLNTPVEDLLAALEADILGDKAQKIATNAANANGNGLQLIAYEGGQHLAGRGGAENNDQLTQLLTSLNRHPKMYHLYQLYLNTWAANGGGLFAHFSHIGTYSKWGSWGVLEYQQQGPTTVKYRALMDYIHGAPAGPVNMQVTTGLDSIPTAPILSWAHTADLNATSVPASQYSVYLQTADGQRIIFDTWDAASICSGITCSVNITDLLPDWGLTDGQYEWWVGAIMPDSSQRWSAAPTYEPHVFNVDLPTAALPNNLTVDPRQGRPQVTFDDDPNTYWIQVWMGPNTTGDHLQWYGRDAEQNSFTCNAGTCAFEPDINWVNGEYAIWMQAWGPGGFSTGGTDAPTTPSWVQGDTFTLPATPPAAPANLTATGVNSSNPTFTWDGSTNATWYEFIIEPSDASWAYSKWSLGYDLGMACGNAAGTCSWTDPAMDGVLSAGDYTIRVRAWGPGGLGDYTGDVTFTYTP